MTNEEIEKLVYGITTRIVNALNRLGNEDAATPMGAIEAHGAAIKEAGDAIAQGMSDAIDTQSTSFMEHAETTSASIDRVSTSIDDVAKALHRIADAIADK